MVKKRGPGRPRKLTPTEIVRSLPVLRKQPHIQSVGLSSDLAKIECARSSKGLHVDVAFEESSRPTRHEVMTVARNMAYSKMTEQQRLVYDLRFVQNPSRTQAEIARQCNLSRVRITLIESDIKRLIGGIFSYLVACMGEENGCDSHPLDTQNQTAVTD